MNLAIIGDQHGNLFNLMQLLEHINEQTNEIEAYIQVGDLGYMGHKKDWYIQEINKLVQPYNRPFYFIDGNHEDHAVLHEMVSNHTEELNKPIAMASHVYYIPRGSILNFNGKTIFFMGGAFSVDRAWRILGQSYWLTEEIQQEDIDRAKANYKKLGQPVIDLAVTHDVPSGVSLDPTKLMTLSPQVSSQAEYNRKQLAYVLRTLKPAHIIHGHYHYSYETETHDLEYETVVTGLGVDEQPLNEQYYLYKVR